MIQNCIQEHLKSVPRLNRLEVCSWRPSDLGTDMDAQGLLNNRLVANYAKYITDITVGYVTDDLVKYEGESIDWIFEVLPARDDFVSQDVELASSITRRAMNAISEVHCKNSFRFDPFWRRSPKNALLLTARNNDGFAARCGSTRRQTRHSLSSGKSGAL
jgi:hypothetical protein